MRFIFEKDNLEDSFEKYERTVENKIYGLIERCREIILPMYNNNFSLNIEYIPMALVFAEVLRNAYKEQFIDDYRIEHGTKDGHICNVHSDDEKVPYRFGIKYPDSISMRTYVFWHYHFETFDISGVCGTTFINTLSQLHDWNRRSIMLVDITHDPLSIGPDMDYKDKILNKSSLYYNTGFDKKGIRKPYDKGPIEVLKFQISPY